MYVPSGYHLAFRFISFLLLPFTNLWWIVTWFPVVCIHMPVSAYIYLYTSMNLSTLDIVYFLLPSIPSIYLCIYVCNLWSISIFQMPEYYNTKKKKKGKIDSSTFSIRCISFGFSYHPSSFQHETTFFPVFIYLSIFQTIFLLPSCLSFFLPLSFPPSRRIPSSVLSA